PLRRRRESCLRARPEEAPDSRRTPRRALVAANRCRRGERSPPEPVVASGSFRRGAEIAGAWAWHPQGRKPLCPCQHPPDGWPPAGDPRPTGGGGPNRAKKDKRTLFRCCERARCAVL